MKREAAETRLREVLEKAHSGFPLASSITEIWVFGSYAKGSLEPRDIDLEVIVERDDQYETQRLAALSNREVRSPQLEIWNALFGKRRCFHVHLDDGRLYEDLGHRLLYRRGDDLETSMERLNQIKADPSATRKERTLPPLKALDGRVSAGELTEISALVDAKWVKAKAITVTFPERDGDEWIPSRLASVYKEGSPLLRAATAGIFELLEHGVASERIAVMGTPAFSRGPCPDRVSMTYEVGWSASVMDSAIAFIADDDSRQYLYLVRPRANGDTTPAILFEGASDRKAELRSFLQLGGLLDKKVEMLPALKDWLSALPTTRFDR